MAGDGAVVVIGGTRAIGREIARHYAGEGREVVLSGRDPETVATTVDELGGRTHGVILDLAHPETIAPALADLGPVQYLVLVAIDRDTNSVKEYDIARAIQLVTLKLVGYTEVTHALLGRLTDDAAVVVFGGMAKDRPYAGSTTVSTVNGGVVGLTRTLVEELRPIRVNSIHPGIVGDSPFWAERLADVEEYRRQTPTGRLTTMADVVDATVFLLENPSVNGIDLIVDNGWHCR
jgi:NAD(P)-dependent dehydrogenase (short-subunit alcohol dehydrogenase family)